MQSNYNRFRIKCNGISVKCFAHASSPLSICLSLAKAYIANASGWTIDIQTPIEPV
nr:MAG TPA: hypothetical protein [Caudoviricetes sp.]